MVLTAKNPSLWMERLYKTYFQRYIAVSLALGLFSVGIFWIFSRYVRWLPWDLFTILCSIGMGGFLAMSLIGIPSILQRARDVLHDGIFKGEPGDENPYLHFQNRLYNPHSLYTTILLVILPFLILNILQLVERGLAFYSLEKTMAGLLLDIFNYLFGYTLLGLLAFTLWIVINISLLMVDIRKEPYRHQVQVNVDAVDGFGGLEPLGSLIRFVVTFYFIGITLLILSYLSPVTIWSYEVFFVIFLLILGLCFMLIGFGTIRRLIRWKVEEDAKGLNILKSNLIRELKEYERKSSSGNSEEDLTKIQTLLELYTTMREHLAQIYSQNRGYDLRTAIQSGIAAILPILAFIQEILPYIPKPV
jgi:hypothetical protein